MKPKVSKHYFSANDGAYEIKRGITIEEIKEIVKDRFLRAVIFNRLRNEDFIYLEKYIFSKRPNVLLSWACKDFSPEPITLNFLRFLPSLKRLSLYGASQITDPGSIEFMKGLKALSFSKCESEVVDILKEMEAGLTSLSIAGVTNKKPFGIDFVSRFKKLKDLSIEGPCKSIEEIGKLTDLRELVLRSVSLPNLDFLIGLNKIWSVDLKLGVIKDFSALYKLPAIKYLELWMVKGVSDVSFISKMTSLQNLHLESLINISQLLSLKKLKLPACKTLYLQVSTNINLKICFLYFKIPMSVIYMYIFQVTRRIKLLKSWRKNIERGCLTRVTLCTNNDCDEILPRIDTTFFCLISCN